MNQNSLRTLDRTIVVFTFINIFVLVGLTVWAVLIARKGFSNQHRGFKEIWDFKPADRRFYQKEGHPDVL